MIGQEVAKFTKAHYQDILKNQQLFASKEDIKEGLRRSFLGLDEALEKPSGMEELAEMKRKNPPKKSPLMKILQDTMKKPNEPQAIEDKTAEAEEGESEGGDLMLDSIGCTANVICIDQELKKIFVANAGDSRCCLGAGGKCIPLSFDHKPESDIERKRIEAVGSVITEERVDGNLNLTRAFGDLKYK